MTIPQRAGDPAPPSVFSPSEKQQQKGISQADMPRRPNAAPTAPGAPAPPGVPQLVKKLADRCARRREEEAASAGLQTWGSAAGLARGAREETAVPEAHRARLQRRAFSILLNYDEVRAGKTLR